MLTFGERGKLFVSFRSMNLAMSDRPYVSFSGAEMVGAGSAVQPKVPAFRNISCPIGMQESKSMITAFPSIVYPMHS
jgi:hypothetical protein